MSNLLPDSITVRSSMIWYNLAAANDNPINGDLRYIRKLGMDLAEAWTNGRVWSPIDIGQATRLAAVALQAYGDEVEISYARLFTNNPDPGISANGCTC